MKVCYVLVIAMLSIGCKENAIEIPFGNTYLFSDVQPINDSEINQFPKKFTGNFFYNDSVFMEITNDAIFYKFNHTFKIHKNELDSIKEFIVFSDNKFKFKDSESILDAKYFKDSIQFTDYRKDTIFVFSPTNKAKKLHGNLVLNYKDNDFWTVKLLSINRENLKMQYLYSESDLQKMDSITKFDAKKIDSTSYLISPSRSEFIRFFKLKNFGYEYNFKKIKQ